MKWLEIVRFELVYQLRRWSTWVFFGVESFLDLLAGAPASGRATLRVLPAAALGRLPASWLSRGMASVEGDHELRRDPVRVFVPLGSPS